MVKRLIVTIGAAASLLTAAALGQAPAQKGGGNETGPYEVVTGWPQNFCGAGHVIGSTGGIWAESADRVFIFSRGCLPELKEDRGPANSFIPSRNASGYDMSQKDPARHPRWDHIVNIVDRDGKLIESWEQHNKLFVRPHRAAPTRRESDDRSPDTRSSCNRSRPRRRRRNCGLRRLA